MPGMTKSFCGRLSMMASNQNSRKCGRLLSAPPEDLQEKYTMLVNPVRPIPGYFTKHHTNLQQNGIIFQKLEKIRDYFPKLRKMRLARLIAGIELVNVIGMEMSSL